MKFASKRDMIVIAAIIAAGAVLWLIFGGLFAGEGSVAEIYYRTELVQTVELQSGKSETFSIDQLPNVVFTVFPDGSIAFTESDCRDKICVNAGKQHLAGQFAACLPNQVYIKIISKDAGNTDGPDIIIG